MVTKEFKAYSQIPVKFLMATKFNKEGEVANLRDDVAAKLINAGIAEKFVVTTPQATKPAKGEKE